MLEESACYLHYFICRAVKLFPIEKIYQILLINFSWVIFLTHFWPYSIPLYVPIPYLLKTPENQGFSGVFREYKMGPLARNGLKNKIPDTNKKIKTLSCLIFFKVITKSKSVKYQEVSKMVLIVRKIRDLSGNFCLRS